ncbi:MAG: hypothetical protein VYE22_25515 [Myxococcota bacterium]|nr:hypothetical protein [Myxococcota bacterium]
MVVVDSDFEVPAALSSLEVRVAHEGEVTAETDFALGAEASEARFTLPLSFGIVPLGGDASRRLRVEVVGRGPGGDALVRQSRVTGFLPGRTLRLPFFLARRCAEVDCAPGETCTLEGCVPELLEPSDLADVRAGEELGLDAGPVPDAGTPDAGIPTSCAGCVPTGPCPVACAEASPCSCADGCACQLDCPSGGDCDGACAGEGTECVVEAERTSNADFRCEAGARCVIDARGASNAELRCQAATCEMDCRDASNCFATCVDGARCLLSCEGTSNCDFRACDGDRRACDGEVLVCNRACP